MLKRIINKLKRIFKPIFIFNKNDKFNKILEELNIDNYSKVIVFENNFGFEGIMKQRPQQIALNIPEDVLFLYHSNKDKYGNKLNYKKIKANVYLINLDIYRKYIYKIKNNNYLMIYSTNYFSIRKIKKYQKNNFKLIYEYVDNIDDMLCGKKLVVKLNKVLNFVINNNAYIITTATKLYDNVISYNSRANVKLITNGCDYNHFHMSEAKLPSDLTLKKPIVGYYGALANWFDYDLIKKINDTNKYKVVLIGQKYDNSFDNSFIEQLKNVVYLGKKEYKELPNYLYYFDICIIPFIINDITLSTSPVKVFEYMAGNKPIVTTALPECMKYESVLISKNHDEFINNLDLAIKLKNNDKYLKKLNNDALSNTWESKCIEMIKFLDY